ncbi:MAG: DUF3224 domain-containing protein [Thaumarchaeota archaeon]|nr:DUF3224 domain-containing protein [Nitrososphaerota archaeon]
MKFIKMLSLNNPYAKTVTIAIVASVLLLAGITMIGPSIAAGSSAKESEKVRATGTVPSTIIDVIADKTVGDLKFTTQRTLATYTGDIQGTQTGFATLTGNSTSKIANTLSTQSFKGTIAGRSGTFAAIQTLISDRSNPSLYVFKGTFTVVESSGQEGLEGICGGGTLMGSGPPTGPFTTTYDYTFRFGDACNSNP